MTAAEIKILKELLLILHPFEEASDDYQADYESIGSVIPAFLDMLNKVTLTKESDGETIQNPLSPLAGKISSCKALADSLKESLERRMSHLLKGTYYVLGTLLKFKYIDFSNPNLHLIVLAAILDPRFKTDWISFTTSSESRSKDRPCCGKIRT